MTYRSFRAAAFVYCLFALACLAGCGGNTSEPAPVVTDAEAAPRSKANAELGFPIPVVELAGTPQEMGTGHGRRLGDIIRKLHHDYLTAYFANPTRRVMAMAATAAFESRVSPEHLAEVNALAKESGVEPRQMLLAQCFLDLSAMTACSTITLPADASPDGVARFGRNLDFPSFDVADKATVVFVQRPGDGRNAFATVGWPGMIGVLSGMNEHGLALANMEVDRERRLPTAMPYTLLYRTVLERCKTVNEAIELLQKTPRQTANSLMLMDATGDRAVVEITPENISVRRATSNQALISTNHHRGEDLSTAGRCRRFDYLRDASTRAFGKIDQARVQVMLGKVAQGKMTLQSMIFEPSNRVIHLAVGAAAHQQPYQRLDLTPYFAK